MDWKGFFSVLAEVGYTGRDEHRERGRVLSIRRTTSGNFTEQFKRGFRMAHEFLKTLVPPVTA